MKYWDQMCRCAFQPIVRLKKFPDSLYNETILENPYVIDYVLNTYYTPFGQTQENNFQSLSVVMERMTCFSDESYTVIGKEILYKLLKVLLLKQRIYLTWVEGGIIN